MSLLALHPTRIARRCSRSLAHRAVVFRTHGDPLDVLHVRTLPDLQHAPRDSVLIRFLCATVNPSDLNVIEGTYPLKPKPRQEGLYVPGNEGLAEVVAVGDDGKLKIGDWVILKSPQLGSWATCALVQQRDIVRVPDDARDKLSCEQLVSITVNPPTALRMLEDFADLHAGDWVLQNGANSAVGRAVIQIAKIKGFKTLNFVRNRDSLEDLRAGLLQLGATHVFTYDDLLQKDFRKQAASLTDHANIRLALNCVGGQIVARMVSLLGPDAHLVTYGGMSKEPIALPTGPFIFKNLTAHGYWQSRWYDKCTESERATLIRRICDMLINKELDAPKSALVRLAGTDGEATEALRSALSRRKTRSEKLLLTWE